MTAQRRTVLLIDDNVEVRSTLVRVLSTCYDVSIADDGETALWRFEQGQRFDVVLCDVFMPKMDGAVLVDHLRRLDADQARRVIVLTSNADSPLAARLSDHYVVEKPFNLGELRELIDRVSAAARDGYFPSVSKTIARRA
jgi:CheY-like chemotaxis protein